MMRYLRWILVLFVLVVSLVPAGSTFAGTAAAFTAVNPAVDGTGHCLNGSLVNCNIYDGKQYVWLSAGPANASLANGSYFFAVLDPSGQTDPNDSGPGNLSSPNDSYTNRTFSINAGTITYSGTHDFANNLIRLVPYNDTPNPGGVYILAVCSLANGYPVATSACKFDAFKVGSQTISSQDLTISKTATPTFTRSFDWIIGKTVDAPTTVKQVGGTHTFTYHVTVTKSGPTDSGWQVAGTITVTNPNSALAFTDVEVTDWVTGADGNIDPNAGLNGICLDSTGLVVPAGGSITVTYSCTYSGPPVSTSETNHAKVVWNQVVTGTPDDHAQYDLPFTWNTGYSGNPTLVHDCVTVTDTFGGSLVTSACAMATYDYTHQFNVPQYGCQQYTNTATLTAIDDPTYTRSAQATVTLCGPAKTGALTMGFWQNKNGQGIITGSASTGGVCNVGTWLRQYNPFQDLSATASCSQVASYVYNTIKSANAGGASMNAMLKAQMLATALDVYFSDPSLGGNKIGAPGPLGSVVIDLTQICQMIDGSGGTATCSGSYENVSSAFGGASSMTVSQMLSYAASQSNVGGLVWWYGQVKAMQQLAKDAFDAINNQVAFSA